MRAQIWTLGLVATLAALLGVVLGVALLDPEPAHAKAASSSDDVVVVSSRLGNGNTDIFWVIHTPSERLLVYEVVGGSLTLGAARNIKWDFKLNELSRVAPQVPTVKKVEKDTQGAKDPKPARGRKLIAVPGKPNAAQDDLLYCLDTVTLRQVIYDYNEGKLQILAARNILHDLKLDEYPQGKHSPRVKEVRERVKQREEEEKKSEVKGT